MFVFQKKLIYYIFYFRSHQLRWKYFNNILKPLNFDPKYRPRRQDWDGELIENGMFYLVSRKQIIEGYLQNNR